MVAKEELLQRCAIVEPRPGHKRYFFHLPCSNGNIGIQPHAERVGKVFPVYHTNIRIHELPRQRPFDGLTRIVRQLESIPGIVIAGASGNYA